MKRIINFLIVLLLLSSCIRTHNDENVVIYKADRLKNTFCKIYKKKDTVFINLNGIHNISFRLVRYADEYVMEGDSSFVVMSNRKDFDTVHTSINKMISRHYHIRNVRMNNTTWVTSLSYAELAYNPIVNIYYNNEYKIIKIKEWYPFITFYPQKNVVRKKCWNPYIYIPKGNVKSFTVKKQGNHISLVCNYMNNKRFQINMYKYKKSYYTNDLGTKRIPILRNDIDRNIFYNGLHLNYGIKRIIMRKENDSIYSTQIYSTNKYNNVCIILFYDSNFSIHHIKKANDYIEFKM